MGKLRAFGIVLLLSLVVASQDRILTYALISSEARSLVFLVGIAIFLISTAFVFSAFRSLKT